MNSNPMSTDDRRERVEDACAALLVAGQPVAVDKVATRAASGEPPSTATPTYERSSRNTARADEKPTPSPG